MNGHKVPLDTLASRPHTEVVLSMEVRRAVKEAIALYKGSKQIRDLWTKSEFLVLIGAKMGQRHMTEALEAQRRQQEALPKILGANGEPTGT